MADQIVYEISRYRVDQPEEVLLETARIVESLDGLVTQGSDGRSVAVLDVATAIGSDPALHEIRPNEITRITARPEVIDELPFQLVAPGEPDDFDENAWSTELAKHVEAVYEHQVGVFRVLFVNGDRWCPWQTYDGQSMLPEAWPVIRLEREWIGISVDTDNDDITWTHRTALGLVSEGVAACLHEPDLRWEIDPSEVGVWRRDGTVDGDARIVVDWLLNSPFQRTWGFSIESMLTRLFLGVAGNGRDEGGFGGHKLAVGDDPQPDAGNLDTDVWWMTVNLSAEVIDAVIDLLAARDATLRDIVVS